MKINEIVKTKSIYFVITLLVVIALSISSSYAFVNKNDYINSNGLEVKYIDTKATSMYIEKTINIKNTNNESKDFNIYVSSLDDSSSISLDKIVYSINDGVESLLKDNNNNSIYSASLNNNEEMNIKLKFWVSYDLLENSDQGKSISIDINVQ
jgi:hypothetical protein